MKLSNNKPGKMSLENIASKLTETTLSSFFLKILVCLLFVFVVYFLKEREGTNGASWVGVGGSYCDQNTLCQKLFSTEKKK